MLWLCRLLAVFALSACGVAHAVIPMAPSFRAVHQSKPVQTAYFATRQQACDAAPAAYVAVYGGAASVKSYEETICRVQHSATGEEPFLYEGGPAVCPANSSQVAGGCQCNADFVENSAQTACVPKPSECEALAGKPVGDAKWDAGTGAWPVGDTHFYCDGWSPAGGGKCVAMAERVACYPDGGRWYCSGPAKYTGATASTCLGLGGAGDDPAGTTPKPPDGVPPDVPQPGTTAPAPCPVGQAPGEVNGERVCAPVGSDRPSAARDKNEVTNPDGSRTQTTSNTRCDAGGARCETATTKCTTPAGSELQTCETTTTTQSRDAMCSKDPGSNACKDGDDEEASEYGGNCQSGFQCKGDAIQCAIAREQSKARCEYENFNAPWKQTAAVDVEGVAEGFKSDGDAAVAGAWTSWVNSSNVTAACPAGYPMELLGQQYTLSLEPLCDVGEGARPIVIAVALLLALRTFLSVVTRD